ncbi:MAG: hypothetical protein IT178_12355 [Acidobacteria bacterium]|nr:hypothetical protein [Acidobacteriota bacterium]
MSGDTYPAGQMPVLDPSASAGTVRRSRWLAATALVLTSIVLLWRRPDALANPQLWAEDGLVFLMQSQQMGVTSLWEPYAGYLHLGARAVAWLMSLAPVVYAPAGYAVASWLLVVLTATYACSSRLALEPLSKAAVALALVATTTSNEVFFNIANWATVAAPWPILLAASTEPTTRRVAVIDAVVLAAALLSTPFAICLWVLFAWRWWKRPTKANAVLLAVSVIVAVTQLAGMTSRAAEASPDSLFARLPLLGTRIAYVFLGEPAHMLPVGGATGAAILSATILLYGWLAWRAWRDQRHPALVFIVASGMLWAVSFFVMRVWAPGDMAFHTGRHQYLGGATLVWAMAASRRSPVTVTGAGLAFAAFVFLTPSNKQVTLPDLKWREEVERCSRATAPCTIPINPLTPSPQAWSVRLPGRP